MALIKCPDCGNEVSSLAAACPRCGYPIAQIAQSNSKIVKVKLPPNSEHTSPTLRIIEAGTDRELARGNANAIVEFEVDAQTEVGMSWGLSYSCKVGARDNFVVMPGKCYALTWGGGWILPHLVCNEVSSFVGI